MKEKISINPLSKKYLRQAVILNKKTFGSNPLLKFFKASLEPEKNKDLYKRIGVKRVQYFVMVDNANNRVIGTTGIYYMTNDKNGTCWLGWFCLDPKYQGRGLGSKLLDFTINLAKKKGSKILKLWTTTSETEARAQVLYEKRNFKIIKREKKSGEKYTTLYRRLILK